MRRQPAPQDNSHRQVDSTPQRTGATGDLVESASAAGLIDASPIAWN